MERPSVKHKELESILQFIYLGEISFYNNDINKLIQAAKDLQIKQPEDTVITGNTFTNQEEPADDYDMESRIDDIYNPDIHVNSEKDTKYENDFPAYNPGSDELGSGKHLYKCEECEATYKRKKALRHHIGNKHEGIVYSCQQCSYKATQQSHLKQHQESVHEGVKYSCNQCEYQAGWKTLLKRHKSAKHSLLEH